MNVASATSTTNRHPHTALCGVNEFIFETYDYIVVSGMYLDPTIRPPFRQTNVVRHIGGTAGLIVTARLTENPDVKVGVIEAGANHMDDKQICTPCLYPTLIGREKYDWCMTSVPR